MRKFSNEKPPGAPIFLTLIVSFVLVSTIPIVVFAIYVYKSAWEYVYEEIREKHGVIATSVASPIYAHLDKYRDLLYLLGESIQNNISQVDQKKLPMLAETLQVYDGLTSLSVLTVDTNNHAELLEGIARINGKGDFHLIEDTDFATPLENMCLEQYYPVGEKSFKTGISGVVTSPFSNEPSILVKYELPLDELKTLVLIAELDVKPFRELADQIKFGTQGHSVIVDHSGKIIAHPIAGPMTDVTNMVAVEEALKGGKGVVEFYSEFKKSDMIAAYTSVPEFGWGVIVPQPLSEVETKVSEFITNQLRWALVGLLVAFLISVTLTQWIRKPINALAKKAIMLKGEESFDSLQPIRRVVPREVNELLISLNRLLNGLKVSRSQIIGIVDHSPLIFLIADKEGVVNFGAGKVLNTLGLNSDQAIGKNLRQIFPDLPRLEKTIAEVMKGEEKLNTYHVNGTILDIWFSPQANEQGYVDHLIVVGTDVSDSHLAAKNAQLLHDNRKLIRRSLNAEEAERKRIAKELHDQISQDLTAVRHHLETIIDIDDELMEEVTEEEAKHLNTAKYHAQQTDLLIGKLQDIIRSMLARLRPAIIDDLGFEAALKQKVGEFKNTYPNIKTIFDSTYYEKEEYLDSNIGLQIYRVLQECLTNVAKHSKANRLKVTLETKYEVVAGKDVEYIFMCCEDNGEGFVYNENKNTPSSSLGLVHIRERVMSLNGQLVVDSKPNKGCKICIKVPLEKTSVMHKKKEFVDIEL